jgi:hypothetical protein
MLRDEISRWSLEVPFEESRAHLGIETQRQWSDRAIERTTPLLLSLYSLVALFGQVLHPDGHIPVAQAAWYRKPTAPFRDVLATVRRHLWGQETFPTSPADPDVVLVPRSALERLSWAVCSSVGNVQSQAEISTPRQTGFAMGHEERAGGWGPACRQILVEKCPDRPREEHLARAVAFAVNANRALGPGNVVDVDGQRFLTAQAPIIDQPEEGAITRVLYFP